MVCCVILLGYFAGLFSDVRGGSNHARVESMINVAFILLFVLVSTLCLAIVVVIAVLGAY